MTILRRRLVPLVAASLFSAGLGSAQPARSSAPITLQQAASSGKVDVSFSGTGASSGDSIKVKVKKRPAAGSGPIDITVPPGTMLDSLNGAFQNMMVAGVAGSMAAGADGSTYTQTSGITLNGPGEQTYILKAYCAEFEKENPTEQVGFNLREPEPVLACLAKEGKTLNVAAMQAAVWMHTDRVTLSRMSAKFPVASLDRNLAERVFNQCANGRQSAPIAIPAPTVRPSSGASRSSSSERAAEAAWNLLRDSNDSKLLSDFIASFPASEWAKVAKIRLSQLGNVALAGRRGRISGTVLGVNGEPLKGAVLAFETTATSPQQVTTDGSGRYTFTAIAQATYDIHLVINGTVKDFVRGLRSRVDEEIVVNFSLKAINDAAIARTANEEGAAKIREVQRLFGAGVNALNAQQWQAAVASFSKALELDSSQVAIWVNLAATYDGWSENAGSGEKAQALAKAAEAYVKTVDLIPNDATLHYKYGLLLARMKRFEEAAAEVSKAAALDPSNAGKYFYNIGAIFVNSGQNANAGLAFKKAIDADPNYADAHYQYGIYLIATAETSPSGAIVFPPETQGAFEKYLDLQPSGRYADSARAMLAVLAPGAKNPSRRK